MIKLNWIVLHKIADCKHKHLYIWCRLVMAMS